MTGEPDNPFVLYITMIPSMDEKVGGGHLEICSGYSVARLAASAIPLAENRLDDTPTGDNALRDNPIALLIITLTINPPC